MKKPIQMAFLGVWLGAAVVQAQTQTQPPPQTAPGTAPETSTSGQQAALNGPQVQAEILSVDAAGKTITVRESTAGAASEAAGKSASPATLPVEGKAITRLGIAKAGDRVTLICAGPSASTTTTTTTATSTTNPASSATAGADTNTQSANPGAAGTASAPASSAATTPETAAADASSPKSALHSTCASVVEIAKARATTTSPQQ